MTITDEEVGIKLAQIQWDVSNAVSSIYDTEDAIFLAHPCESFKWKANSRKRDDGVEDGSFRRVAFV